MAEHKGRGRGPLRLLFGLTFACLVTLIGFHGYFTSVQAKTIYAYEFGPLL